MVTMCSPYLPAIPQTSEIALQIPRKRKLSEI